MQEQQQPEAPSGQPAGQNPVPEPANQPTQQGQEGGQNAGQQPPPQPAPIQPPPPQPGPPVMMQEAQAPPPQQSPGDFRDIYSAGAQSVIEAFRAQREAEEAVAIAEASVQAMRVSVLDGENMLAARQAKVAEAKAKTVKCVKAQAKLLENYLNEESGT